MRGRFSRWLKRRRAFLLFMAFVGALGTVLTLTDASSLAAQGACKVLNGSPLSDFCVPLGHAPSREERAAWDRIGTSAVDCELLREHVRNHPHGFYLEDSQSRLAARSTISESALAPADLDFPFQVDSAAFLTESEARQDAIMRGEADARERCARHADRSKSAFNVTTTPGELSCDLRPDGWRCTRNGEAMCTYQIVEVVEKEMC